MPINNISPFIPGAVVAVARHHRFDSYTDYRRDAVAKVYKNGNFTLKSDLKQQWKPRSRWNEIEKSREWYAAQTGSFNSLSVYIWDESINEDIQEQNARRAHISRAHAIGDIFSRNGRMEWLDRGLVQEITDIILRRLFSEPTIWGAVSATPCSLEDFAGERS